MARNNVPTKLPTICVAFPRELLVEINKYQKKTGIISKAEVIRQLVRIALQQTEPKDEPSE